MSPASASFWEVLNLSLIGATHLDELSAFEVCRLQQVTSISEASTGTEEAASLQKTTKLMLNAV